MLITYAVLVGVLLSPLSVREKEPPAAWKLAELNALLPNPDDAGPVSILVWEVIDVGHEALGREERCVVVKQYAKPTATGATCVLGYLTREWLPDVKEPRWKAQVLYLPFKPGESREVVGVEGYKSLPTDIQIAAFLKKLAWEFQLEPGEVTIGGRGVPRRVEKYFPKLTDGGLCPAAWEKVFDRPPPATLFPELVVVPTAKK